MRALADVLLRTMLLFVLVSSVNVPICRALEVRNVSGTSQEPHRNLTGTSGFVSDSFSAISDPVSASSQDIQRLYEQCTSASAIAYLLFAAAQPLSQCNGSSNALLPYLAPIIIRPYVSRPDRCASPVFEQLFRLSQKLYGSSTLQACHYDLYIALREVFTWVRDNIPLQLQGVPGQPLASAMWPDMTKYPAQRLTAAVADALANPAKLGDTARLVNASCGLSPRDFAALVPDISVALKQLHADLPLLQTVATRLYESHWAAEATETFSVPTNSRIQRQSAADPRTLRAVSTTTSKTGAARYDALLLQDMGSNADVASRSHRHLTSTTTFYYTMPPSPFSASGPAAMPALLVPIIFHIMLYTDSSGAIGPANYDKAPAYLDRLVRLANYMAKPTNIQFFVKEVRNNATNYPDLLVRNRLTWLNLPNCRTGACLRDKKFLMKLITDFPRSLNIFVTSDTTSTQNPVVGYAFAPGSDVDPNTGFIFISWDCVSTSGYNSLSQYNYGPTVLVHECFHHLGLEHSFGTNIIEKTCLDDDYVIDTPVTLGAVSASSSILTTARAYCMELFWGQYGGDWDATYIRWSSTLGIPDTDMNAWADSCPGNPGYDELGNYMTYNTAVCFAALGHFTEGQAQRAHYVTSELNPVLYAWGQYYAQNAAPPPPQASPPPESYTHLCKATESRCACKSVWSYDGNNYSYCDRILNSSNLWCEVLDSSSCAGCTAVSSPQCVLGCTGTPQICKVPPAPGTSMPPPPPPRSPSPPPFPPPPPPRSIPASCKISVTGCDCRSTWKYGIMFVSYCGSPNGSSPLWCQVTSSCPQYDSSPYQYCDSRLTVDYCGGPIYISTTRNSQVPVPLQPFPSPSPPSLRPPSLPPSLPSFPTSPVPPSPIPPSPLPPSPTIPSLPSPFPIPPSQPSTPPGVPPPPPPLYPPVLPPGSLQPPSPQQPSPPSRPQPSPAPLLAPPLPLSSIPPSLIQRGPLPRPPSFPRPPSLSPPSPQPPVLNLVGLLRGNLTVAASCSLLDAPARKTAFTNDLTQELARVFQVSTTYIRIRSLGCGSIVAAYSIYFYEGLPQATMISASARADNLSSQVSSGFTSSWGPVTASSSSGLAMDSGIPPGGMPSLQFPASPPPPPPPLLPTTTKDKAKLSIAIIVGAATGGLVAVILLISGTVWFISWRRRRTAITTVVRRDRRVAPGSQSPPIPPGYSVIYAGPMFE
ncbi:hypothetical protein Vafri_5628 [Volvox africanus]|uniref:Peptidase M43 pregnancy-associated plasma-A domain-containing protein n=1 Tax=Volvox africanus TaxID=51714 RepID=A0A8J4AW88_9CHLO|nr:hypothetical protein Vafri_5628 [Volvox africanus]